MKLFVAMSCLQGRPMHDAFDELAALGVDGVQLTPGNAPTLGFARHCLDSEVVTRTHHGFAPAAMRIEVWDDQFNPRGDWHSVHPPRAADEDWLPAPHVDVCLETMYPGYPLGSGSALDAAMGDGVRLAVDVSHVFIQQEQGVMADATWRRLQDYERIEEIHLSANDGRRDRHAPLSSATFGLEWAQRRSAQTSTPLVLECYMHKLDATQRLMQIEIARGQA
jgi:sugar phosphate isomerase/epimerase